jgi:hypothetical protein
MALSDSKVVIAGVGHFYTKVAGSVYPTTPTNPTGADGWVELGHTSADNPLTVKRSGGDVTTNGTWQNPSLRTSVAPVSYSVEFTGLQVDTTTLTFYYGGGSGDPSTTGFIVPTNPAPQNTALFVRIIDATNSNVERYWHFPTTSVIGSDDNSFATDDFAGYPLSFTVLNDTTLGGLFKIMAA